MSETCPTVRIVAPVTADNPAGFVVINETDLAETDALFEVSADPFDAMARADMFTFLSMRGVNTGPNTGTNRLKTLCRDNAQTPIQADAPAPPETQSGE